jgi:hypothetical protein
MRESEVAMYDMLSSDILQVLIAVEGRYIQWEWDPQTLQNDYITLREVDGQSKRASGFRIYRPTEEGRSRCNFPKASAAA